MSLSERLHMEEQGTAAGLALRYLRFGPESINWKESMAGRSRTAQERIKRHMWRMIEDNRRAPGQPGTGGEANG